MKRPAPSASQTKEYHFEDGARRIGVSRVHLKLLNMDIRVLASETKRGAPITVFGEEKNFTHDKPNENLKAGEWQLKVKHGSNYYQYYTYVELPPDVQAAVEAQLRRNANGTDYGSR